MIKLSTNWLKLKLIKREKETSGVSGAVHLSCYSSYLRDSLVAHLIENGG